ncbi:disease resistance protein At4g27190-like isoform X1 [Actinidia eriantha]|uniref:disease resistance protein At4g27190-like isoform X1 n=1 Tax=Actinidia eriantha TaxID=165200 RepID=UPI002590E70E|nr:disease resistance protein At4g27190-like isoform X1 [Actinidia eriantha]
MALGIFIALLMKAGGYLVEPIGRRLRYVFHYSRNVENFRKEVEKLGDMRDGTLQSLNAATRNGEEIKINIHKWLAKVDGVLAEAEGLDDEIASDKRCFGGWSADWSSRYKLGKEAAMKTANIMELQGDAQFVNISFHVPPPSIVFNNDLLTFESSESTIDEIMEALHDNKCDIVVVYGMGGLGKTTLVKEVGKRAKKLKLFDQVVMAVVSQTPDLRKIQGQLGDMLGIQFREETESGRADRLFASLKYEKSILVILDDIWKSIKLADIGIPQGEEHKGCKIILTTRGANACNAMGVNMKKIPVGFLSSEESWDLFRKYVGPVIDTSTLNDVATEVARECQGLPLALVTVGRALRDKSLEGWKAALQRLKRSKSVNVDDTEDVFSCLKLSYEYLGDDETKFCFLLCCLFPEDYDIQIEGLARFAMGKRLFSDVDTMEEARRQTHEIIMHLKASCLLLDSDKEGCVKMHDMVRDLAIGIASRGNITFLVRAGLGLKEWPNMETFEDSMCISLMTSDIKKLPVGLKCPKLQMLLLGDNEGIEEFPEAFLRGMPELRVLDLSERVGFRSLLPVSSFSVNMSVLPSILSVLPSILTLPHSRPFLEHLRTLHLDRCKLGNISILGKLKMLEILSFFGSDIEILPREIGELSNLRLLDLTFCQYLRTVPANVISRLSRLEELYMGCTFKRWALKGTGQERSIACLSELVSLPRLTILCVELRHVACFPNDLLLHNLHKFEVTIGFQDSVKCYPNSKSLYLKEIETAIPIEVKTIIQLTEELTLFCAKEINIVPDISSCGLNDLKYLKIVSCDSMFSLINANEESPPVIFAALEELHLLHLDNIRALCRGSLQTPSLRKLRILTVERCNFYVSFLPFELLNNLQSLEEVTIERCENVTICFFLPRLRTEKLLGNEEHLPLSTLKRLRLVALRSLLWLWHTKQPLASLQNLTVVEIIECGGLRYLFPHSIAQSLQQLEFLKIKECSSLERIVAKAEEGNPKDCAQAVGFPNLKIVQVEGCRNLRSLLPVTTVRSLQQLNKITIIKCELLVEIISHVQEGEDEDDDEILLPKVKSFEVRDMSSLKRLCSENFSLNLPGLKDLVVDRCPMMGTFATDGPAYGLRSASKLKKVQVDGQTLSATAIQQLFSRKG